MLKRLAAAVFCGVAALISLPAFAAEPLSFALADKAPLRQFSIGEFAPGTMERGAIETQTPTVRLPVSGLLLSLDTGGDTDCGEGTDISAALAKPDTDAAASAAADQCLFLAQLTLSSERGQLNIVGQCDEWRKDTSYCWVEGDIGQFWLHRASGKNTALQIIMGPSDALTVPQAAIAPASGPVPAAIPSHGIMLDSVFDDAGRAVLDRWLLLPSGVVTLEVAR